MYTLEGFAKLDVRKFVKGVEIGADCPRKEDGILWNDGQAGAEVVELDGRDVNSIDGNASFSGFEEAEEC